MEDIHYQFQNYLFTFELSTTAESFQKEVANYNLSLQKTYSVVYDSLSHHLHEILNLMTNSKAFDYSHLKGLSNVLFFINKIYLKKLETIVLSKCENIFDTCLEILELISKAEETDYSKPDLVLLIIVIIQEVMKPYPNDLYLHTNNQRYLNLLVVKLSTYSEVRNFILFLIQSNKNRDVYNFMIKNISNFFEGIKRLMLTMPFEDITKETVTIAIQFRTNFKDIINEFQSFLSFILANTVNKRSEKELKYFFSSLFNVIQDDKHVCYGIGNMLLQVYEDNIASPEICQPVISSFFTEISGEFYIRLLQNTDLIRKFISKLYNQRNQETIAFFFYFLNSLSFSYEMAKNEVYIPKIEFKTIIEEIQYFTDNEVILKFIFERLMSLFDQKTTLGTYFLEECDYFQQMKAILSLNNNISMLVLDFTEELLKKNCSEKIWEKATRSNVFHFEAISQLHPLMQKIIAISLTYEQKPETFYDKAQKITQHIYSKTKCEDNGGDFLILLKILLKSISQKNNQVVYSVRHALFNDIARLVEDFLVIISGKQALWSSLLTLFDLVFAFVFQFNRSLSSYKFNEGNSKAERIIRSPVVFSLQTIKDYLLIALAKLNEEGSRNLLCYLFRKCIDFTDSDDCTLFEANKLSPIDYCFKTFHIPSIESSVKYSNIFINSHLIIKCVLSAVFKAHSLNNKLYLLSYLELLCRVNGQNCEVLLRGRIVKKLLRHISTKFLTEPIQLLFSRLVLYFSKEDLIEYLKHVYILLVTHSNAASALKLLEIIELNQSLSLKNTSSITLSPNNTHHTGTYYMLFLDNQQTKSSNIQVYYTLFVPSIESLTYFTLGQFVTYDNTVQIYFDKESLQFSLNNKKICLRSFNQKLTSFNRWYSVLIQPGNEFTANIKQSLLVITYPKNCIFESNDSNSKSFDFAAGYVYLKEITKRNDQLSFVYNEACAYVQMSYLVITKEEISEKAISKSDSKAFSIQKPRIRTKEIIAEVFFDGLSLVKLQNKANLTYKMSDPYDLDSTKTELLVKIQCNDGINGYNDLYLFKNCNVLDYASLNDIFRLETLSKPFLLRCLFSFNHYLHVTLNDSFIADLLLSLMQNMDKTTFLAVYKSIFRVILVVNGEFQLMFFERHMKSLKILFSSYAEDLQVDFVSLLIYNKYVDINERLQYQIIAELFFYPHLYVKLKHDIKKKINTEFEKFLNYYEDNEEIDYAKMKMILVSLWNLFIHYEIDTSIPPGEESHLNSLSGCIELLNLIIINGKNSHSEMAYLSGLAVLFQSTFGEYDTVKLKQKKNQIGSDLPFLASETIEKQMSLMKMLFKEFISSSSSNQQKGVLTYLSHHFILEFEVFKNKIRYEKVKRSLNKRMQLLFSELRIKGKYSWYLDRKEGSARMKKKMIFKENNDKANDENDKEINGMFKMLSLYDAYADIPLVKCLVDEEDKYQTCFICLFIERIYETASLLVLGETFMYLFTNVICNKNKKLFPFTTASTRAFWARNDIDDEWEALVGRGKQKEEEDKNILINHKSRRITIKVFDYKEISELHKRRYMHQNNSIEIFLLNGSSYFITVFPNVRDDLFARILTNINDQSAQSKITNINKSSSPTVVYLKHYPIIIQRSKLNKKIEMPQAKTVIETKNIILDIGDKWSQCFIPNFNYLMMLNTLGGRTYNDMSQYFIFPWLLKDFFSHTFCLNDDAYFRDLTYPTHAQSPLLRANLKNKISSSLNDSEICHSGVFFSNLTQISYYFLRLNPFTEVALEIHGGDFDSSDRLFASMKIFCEMKNISQEWIPEIIYLPELLINMNSYAFGKEKELKDDITCNDVILPPWAKNDPKFFSQVMMKAVESPKVSEGLHNWIDLLFGYKMAYGKINFEFFNRYLSLSYFFEDLKGRKYDKTKLNEMLFQTKEFGSNPLQLFLKSHIQKKEGNIFSFLPFFGTLARIENCLLKISKATCKIRSKRIGDMRGLYELPKQNVSNGEGGLSSLSLYIDQSLDEFNEEEGKITRKYFLVGKNKSLIGRSFTSVLSHSSTSLYISKPFFNYSFEFTIKEQGRISTSTSTLNGKYIIIGLSSGAIIKYRKRTIRSEEVVVPSNLETKEVKAKGGGDSKSNAVIHPKILFFDGSDEHFFDFSEVDNTLPLKFQKKHSAIYSLHEAKRANVCPTAITCLCLCECYSFLLAADAQSNIYLFDLNELKLRYMFCFNKTANVPYDIKHVKVINSTCDFLIATRYSLHLYSINGLPILDVNLFETHHFFGKSPISAIEAVSLNETLIFTGHADGSIYISKLITEVPYDSHKEMSSSAAHDRPLYEAFHQRYNPSYKTSHVNNKLQQKRRLNLIKKIDTAQQKIIHLKISDDMMHLYIINNVKEVFCYGCEEYLKDNLIKGKKCSIHKNTVKVQCKYCKRLICEMCLENDTNSSAGLCEECNLSNTSSEKLTHDY